MVGGQPGPRGDYNPSTRRAQFPNDYGLLTARSHKPEVTLLDNVASSITSEVAHVGTCESWVVYVQLTAGTVTIQGSMAPGQPGEWVTIIASMGDGTFYPTEDDTIVSHPFIRVVTDGSGSGVTVKLLKKFGTY